MTPCPPVAFIIFRRPAHTRRVFEAIRAARPARLMIIADGGRDEAERELVAQARAVVAEIDWPCRVDRLYADDNMGCGLRVSSGLDWAFAQEPELIVLEDDCLPDPSFFGFCGALLARHRDDPKVMMVGGFNPLETWRADQGDYFMAATGFIWGWAGWRRAWAHYDFAMRSWPRQRAVVERYLGAADQAAFWGPILQKVHDGWLPSWDLQWMATIWAREALAATPTTNLVTNIGSDDLGTFMTRSVPLLDSLRAGAVALPPRLAGSGARDAEFDARAFELLNGVPPPQMVLTIAGRLAARGEIMRALAIARAGLTAHPGHPAIKALFADLCARLGRPELARRI